MIQKQKIQLFNSPKILIFFLLILLVGSFIYFAVYNPSFFVPISIALIIIIVYLMPLRSRMIKQQASGELQIEDIHERMNLAMTEIEHEEKAIEAYRKKIVNFSQLKGMTERLSMCLTLEDATKTLSSEVNTLFGDQDTTIILYLFQSKTGELGLSLSQKGQLKVNIKSKKGDIFDQWIVKSMQPLLIEDTKSDYRFDVEKMDNIDMRPVRSLISHPLCVGNKALGILRIDSPKEKYFTTDDLRFLTTIGDVGALAIENAQLYERVEQLAIKDSLTKLYLRRYLLDRIPGEISRQSRWKKHLSFLMIDLDHFKKYNDKFGHVAGDIVLRRVGLLLKDFFNIPGDLVCRYGGEEFFVMLLDCPKTKAIELAEKIRKKIEKQIILLRRENTHITVSIGIATFPQDARIKDDLVSKADQALYHAKEKGRNQVYAG